MEVFGAISDNFTLSIGEKKEINKSGNQTEAIYVASLLLIVTFYFPDSC